MSWRDGLGAFLLVLTLLCSVPTFVLLFQVGVASLSRRSRSDPIKDSERTGTLAVLMPAHDEAGGIAASITSILPQLRPGDRLLVVADNCSDDTAAVARAAGAEVTERNDPVRRGKGHALDHGTRFLESDPPGLVVILDADCIAAPHALEHLAMRCIASGRPAQALYLMHAPVEAPLGTRIAEFAWVLRNKIRPSAYSVLGWPCQLMGTGMVFPWPTLRDAPLATSHLVEDMQLGLHLARAGSAPLFCPEALVTSFFPTGAEAAHSQRTRWEHGHLALLATLGPRLLWSGLARMHADSIAMAMDLMVPPVAALVLLHGALLVMNGLWAFVGDASPLAVSLVALAALALAVTLAWRREGRGLLAPRELLSLPLYVVAKVPIYFRLFTRRQVEWVRTKRDGRER